MVIEREGEERRGEESLVSAEVKRRGIVEVAVRELRVKPVLPSSLTRTVMESEEVYVRVVSGWYNRGWKAALRDARVPRIVRGEE